jgi:hypothetical protein
MIDEVECVCEGSVERFDVAFVMQVDVDAHASYGQANVFAVSGSGDGPVVSKFKHFHVK